jgi:phage gp29-like protein
MAKDKQDDAGITETDIVESIDELESLIEDTELPPELHGEIPVLNDIVDPDEARRDTQDESETAITTTNNVEGIPLERLNDLMDRVDRKLSSELDSFVDLLKDTIKDSIINELKEELKKEAMQMDPAQSEADPSDDPSK